MDDKCMGSMKYKIYELYLKMLRREDMDAIISELLEMTGRDPGNASVLLALAIAYMITKETNKARKQLKKIEVIEILFNI